MQALGDLRDLEDAVHDVRPADHEQLVRVGSRRRVELEHEPQPGRVEEAHAAEVEDDLREAGLQQPRDLGLQLVDRRDVELADRRDAHGLALRLDVDAERLEFSRQRVWLARGHVWKVNLDECRADCAGWPSRGSGTP